MDSAGAAAAVTDTIRTLLGSPGLAPAAAERLQLAIDELIGDDGGHAANGATTLLEKNNVNAALQKLEHAVEALQAASALGAPDTSDLQSLLALAVKSQALDIVQVAEQAADSRQDDRKVSAAQRSMQDGQAAFGNSAFLTAIEQWQRAARTAVTVMR